ncbi:MAG: GxxExxY protein [Chitinophagaceae bacterium]|nr:GxxExxY protein [Chitinophagaceae bacterium]
MGGNVNCTNSLTEMVIVLAMRIHTQLGPGLLEKVYVECLYYELIKHGYMVEKQKYLMVNYESIQIPIGYKIDLLVEDQLVLEIKSAESIHPIFIAQTLTYMKLGEYKIGLILNFNVTSMRFGIKRLVR